MNKQKRQEQLARNAGTAAQAADPAPDPEGLGGQQQVEGEAAMEVVVDGAAAAQLTVEQRAANIDGDIVYSEHNAPRMQARGPGKHYK